MITNEQARKEFSNSINDAFQALIPFYGSQLESGAKYLKLTNEEMINIIHDQTAHFVWSTLESSRTEFGNEFYNEAKARFDKIMLTGVKDAH